MDETAKALFLPIKTNEEDQDMQQDQLPTENYTRNQAPFLVERIVQNTSPSTADTNMSPSKPDFSEFCRERYMQIMKSDPIFSLNKQHVSSVIAEEWKQIGLP